MIDDLIDQICRVFGYTKGMLGEGDLERLAELVSPTLKANDGKSRLARDVENRIEELEAEAEGAAAIIAAERAEVLALRRKLAKAVLDLEAAKGFYQVTHIHAALDAILAELKGQTDER